MFALTKHLTHGRFFLFAYREPLNKSAAASAWDIKSAGGKREKVPAIASPSLLSIPLTFLSISGMLSID
jgi:hypothetical protein